MSLGDRKNKRHDAHPHLHLLDHLLAKGADFGGAGDGHVLRALVLAGDAVERCRVVLHVAQVRLQAAEQKHDLKPLMVNSALCWQKQSLHICLNPL